MTALGQPVRFAAGGTVRTAYRQAGNGPLLLLIHGAEADHTMFLGLMDALAHDFCVIAYDQRDSGQTENGSEPYDLAALAADAAALIRVVLDATSARRAHLYGTSFGGQIAQVIAARHGELVDRLILASTWPIDRKLVDVNATALEALARLRLHLHLPDSADQIASYFFSPAFMAAHPDMAEMFRATRRSREQASRRAQMMQAPPPPVDVASISAPTLLLAGGVDRLIPPAETMALAERIANAQQTILSDMPHVGAIERPDLVAQAIRNFIQPS